MYDKLLKDLRYWYRLYLETDNKNSEVARLLNDAAIAIEDLQKKIPKKKPSIKKEPCICGRKQLDTWYHANGGCFLKCPKCGRRSETVKYRSQLPEAWNKMIAEEKEKANDTV